MKTCSKCNIEKQEAEFGKRKEAKDGLRTDCKSCVSLRDSIYRSENKQAIALNQAVYRAENQEACKQRRAKYYAENKAAIYAQRREYIDEKREEIAAQTMAYRIKNAHSITAKKQEHYIRNKDQIAEKMRDYYARNKERFLAYSHARKARIRNAEGTHTAIDVLRIFENQRGLCANCTTKLFRSGKQKYHVDHVMPLAKGGSNDKRNLQCLCPPCNMRKNAKDPIRWAAENGRLL